MAAQALKGLVDPRHTAVIVIDLQNDFCHNEGGLAKSGRDVCLMQQAAYHTKDFLSEVRKRHVPIIFVRVRHSSWTNSPAWLRKRGEKALSTCLDGTWGEEFFVVRPEKGDVVVVKNRYSAFKGTNLDLILRSKSIQTIILTGVGTNVCVESTARDGFQMDYDTVLLSDCTGSSTLEEHQRSLNVLAQHFGYVVSSKDVTDAWEKG
ncbi:MAG: cysteine hydrolase [Desulfobacterales bacterium]|nr:cysteine hydrolase [Desulfobacterales bacterium]